MPGTKRRIFSFRDVTDWFLIAVGSTIMGASYSLFLIPHSIVPGGVGGISIILHSLFKLPVGITIVVINIPIFFMAFKVLGKSFGIKSIAGLVLSSLMIDFFTYIVPLPSATSNRILGAVFGGLLLGVGLGIVFRGKGSTGGSDIIGQIINKYFNVSVGVGIMLVDFVIISSTVFVFHSLEEPLYGYLALYISSRIIDVILEGWAYAKMAFIITDHPDRVARFINKGINRGVTALKSRRIYTNEEKESLMCVVEKKQIPFLKRGVKKIDPRAFIVIFDVYEVLGKGFKPRT